MDSLELSQIIGKIDALYTMIDERIKSVRLASEEQKHDLLYGALARAKLAYKPLRFNRDNTFNKQVYADLASIQRATNDALGNQELVFIQEIRDEDGTTFIYSRLGHSSGQYIMSRTRPIIPAHNLAKSDNQRFGESVAYLKRQVLQAMLGIVADNDPEDDDSADTSEYAYNNEVRNSMGNDTRPAHVDQGIISEKITKDQLNEIHMELEHYPVMAANLKRMHELNNLSDMPKAKYTGIMQTIRKQKITLMNSPKKEW